MSNSQLPSNETNCIVVDKEGYVWIGTTSGLAVVLNPSSVLTGSKTIIRKSSLISEQPINDILIDALNNKWVATNNGVFVISSDGSSVIAQINTQNSPLLSDEVMALTSNNKNGRIYFGTKKGLIEATSLSVQPLPDYEITCYPQPFNPDKHKQLTIDGLAGDSEIRIVTASGELIRKLQSQGRITLWDGRNENGELVSNGIYLIFASSVTSNVSGVGKIAVLRK
jgi:ligand-binding sensor domain-containing protein